MEAPNSGGGGGGHKRPLPPSSLPPASGPRARARRTLHTRIGRPLDEATRGLLAGVKQRWEREAATAPPSQQVQQQPAVSASAPPDVLPIEPPPLPAPPAAAPAPAAAPPQESQPQRPGAGPLVFLGVAPAGKEEGSGLLLLAAEVDDGPGASSNAGRGSRRLLDWRPPRSRKHFRLGGLWQGLLVRLREQQQHQQQQHGKDDSSTAGVGGAALARSNTGPSSTARSSATALTLTNALPGLQLLLDYYDSAACHRLFSPREQQALAALESCSWQAKAALSLLLSAGPLPLSTHGTAGARWALLALLLRTDSPLPHGMQTLGKRGPVRALGLRLSSSPPSSTAALQELEAAGLAALDTPIAGQGAFWRARAVVKEALRRLAFLYTGSWELVQEEEEGDGEGGGGLGVQGAVAAAVTAAAGSVSPTAGMLTPLAATLALLSSHALGLFILPSQHDDGAAAAGGRGLAHLFASRADLERLLQARRWRLRVVLCPLRGTEEEGGKGKGVVRLLEEVVWGLYSKDSEESKGPPTVGLKRYVQSRVDAEVAAREAALVNEGAVEVSALRYSCTWQWARGVFAGASWLRRKGEDPAVAARLFGLLLRTQDLIPFTAGIRRECWVALATVQKAAAYALKAATKKKKKGKAAARPKDGGRDSEEEDDDDEEDEEARGLGWERACAALAETYDGALADVMQEVQGGDRLAMERERRALRGVVRKAKRDGGGSSSMDTSAQSGTPAGGEEFEVGEGAYRQVYVEAVHESALKRRKGGRKGRRRRGAGKRIVFEGGRNVEEVAVDAYAALGYQGLFSESRLFRALLRLLLWDQIMDRRVAGAFPCPLPIPTRLPLDMEDGRVFYLRRDAAIEARLRELEGLARERRLGQAVAAAWDRHWPAVVWSGGRWTCAGLTRRRAVELACGLAQAGLLVPTLRYLAMNLSAWSRGLPDLVLWAPAGAVTRALPAGGKAGSRPDAPAASADRVVWQRRQAQRRFVEYRRRLQAVQEEEEEAAAAGAAAGAAGAAGAASAFETPQDDAGPVEPPEVFVDVEVNVEDAETLGEEEEEEDEGSEEEDEEDEEDGDEEGERLAAVLAADGPASPQQEMAESQQRGLLLTQAPEVLLLDAEEAARHDAAGAGGQSAGCGSYESMSLASAGPSPLPAEDREIEVKLVEVKSRNDHLSDYQLAWISRFLKHEAAPPPPSSASASAAARNGLRGAAPPATVFELCHVHSITHT